jgi:hypothetical protein
MTATIIEPLRKTRINGQPYTRLPNIQAKLVELSGLQRGELSVRCAVEDRESENYIPSECLVHLVRAHRSEPFDECSEILFKTLMERALHGLPAESLDGKTERLTACNLREELWHRFVELLMKDRQGYVERLDFFEIRFGKALKTLRIDAKEKVYGQDKPLESIEIDHETGELSEKVERAAGSYDHLDWDSFADRDSLLALDKAIDALPALEKAIIEMDRKGIPVESKEPGVVNISSVLRKTPKTIRKHRDTAYATLRAVLTKGE